MSVPICKNYESELLFHYPNGQLRDQRFYRNGKREGEWKTWYENGRL